MPNTMPPKKRLPATGDQVLREIWHIKDTLSAAYDHDVGRLFAESRRHQAERRKPSHACVREKAGKDMKERADRTVKNRCAERLTADRRRSDLRS